MKHKSERAGEQVQDARSREPSRGNGVHDDGSNRRALSSGASHQKESSYGSHSAENRGRRQKRWRVRVVRIDARKYPQFLRDPDHPFIGMAPEARVAEIDSFCARLWVQNVKSRSQTCAAGRIWSAAA
jgi:hypothetical protein